MTDDLQHEAEQRRDAARLRRRDSTTDVEPPRPVRIYRMTDGAPEYVATDEMADGDPLEALRRLFGEGARCDCIENRPLEGDVWRVEAGGDSGEYLTRRTLIERE